MPWKLTSNHGWKFSYLHFITIYKYIFCWCVLKKQKCPSCTATGSLALDTGFFTPEQFMWLLGKEWSPWELRVKQSQPIPFSYMQSCGKEFRTSLPYQLLPQASWIVNSISRIGRETLKGTQVLLNCSIWMQVKSISAPRDLVSFFKAT